MARPIKVIPTLDGEAAAVFLKRAKEVERRYKKKKQAGELKDITKDPKYLAMKKLFDNPLVL